MLRAAIAFAVLAATATPAWPCLNGTILEGDDAVRAIVQVELALEAGRYGEARSILGGSGDVHWLNESVTGRVNDAEVLLALRTAPRRAAKTAADYFAKRSKAQPKNLRYQAWLAEAYATLNKREQALAILTDLVERDLMPDGFAYVTLAKLSDGVKVDEWLDVCKKRAKAKSICVIPTTARAPAKKTRPSNKMKLPG